jgi:hypothetical protein
MASEDPSTIFPKKTLFSGHFGSGGLNESIFSGFSYCVISPNLKEQRTVVVNFVGMK